VRVKNEFGQELIDENRGSPENTGLDFKAEQYVLGRQVNWAESLTHIVP
jgi:hypothetical protein